MISTIYIPTFKRVNEQVTLTFLPKKYRNMVTLVVQGQEVSEHKKYESQVNRIMEVGNNIGIAKTRELICKDAGHQRFYMIDDDIVFHRRNRKYYKDFNNKSNMKKSQRVATKKDINEMFKLVDSWLDESDLISVGHRRHFYPPYASNLSYSENSLAHGVVAIDGEKLGEFIDDVDWTLCEYGEDVNFNFEYMSRGFRNRITDEFCAQMRYYQKGGVNEDRNVKTFKESHDKLMNKWPEYVTLKDKSVVREGIGEITEYKYNWRKAYKEQINNK